VKNYLLEETCSRVRTLTHLLGKLGASEVRRGEGYGEENYSSDTVSKA